MAFEPICSGTIAIAMPSINGNATPKARTTRYSDASCTIESSSRIEYPVALMRSNPRNAPTTADAAPASRAVTMKRRPIFLWSVVVAHDPMPTTSAPRAPAPEEDAAAGAEACVSNVVMEG